MQCRTAPRVGVPLSCLGLGGHEFLADGRSRGFNEDSRRAITPGEFFDGFGCEKRLAVLRAAFEAGINVGVDVTPKDLGNFDAVVICTGATVPRDLPIPGRDLPSRVWRRPR